MKNSIILLIAILVSVTSINYAQEDTRDELRIGPKIGVNYANVYDSKGQDFEADPKLGMALGGFVAIPLGTLVGIQTELLYSQKGFRGSGNILGLNYEVTRTTSYLDVPVYFALKPSRYFTFVAGPQFSYLVSRKDVFNSSTTTIEQEQEFENDNIRKNTLGASMGIDFNLNPIVIGARTNWDLQENNGDGTSSTPRYKNQWIQLTMGFVF
jgi:hypothetical protein